MLDALSRLGDYLRTEGVVADLHIVGGAVLVTEFSARDATADVDAFDYQPHGAVERAAAAVALDMDLPRSWLNQQAPVYVPREAHWRRSTSFDHPHLHVYAIAAEQLLARKVQAGRPTDAEDIAFLCQHLGITAAAEVERVTRAAFPHDELSARGMALARDVLGN